MITELELYDEEHTVFVPIVGLSPATTQQILGPITLHTATPEFLQRIATDAGFTPDYVKQHTDAWVWAEVHVVAEPKCAVARAEAQCLPLIDVLRFWMACLADRAPCAIGLQGDVITTERPRIVIETASQRKSFDPHRSRLIPGFPLNENVMEAVRSLQLDVLVQLINERSEHQTDFVKLVRHALHLFGNGKVQATGADRFLSFVTCLETFLSVSEASINQSVAEGVVMFLDIPVSERVQLKKELQRLYGLRSKLSHGRQTEVPVEDLFLLEDLTKAFLRAMIAHREQFHSKEALIAALEHRRLA